MATVYTNSLFSENAGDLKKLRRP